MEIKNGKGTIPGLIISSTHSLKQDVSGGQSSVSSRIKENANSGGK